MNRRRELAAALLLSAFVSIFLVADPARGLQEREGPVPLTQTDVVRLLAGSTYDQEEIEDIVRRSCLDFRPSEDDYDNYRRLGASDGVIAVLRSCARRSSASTSASRPEARPREEPAQLALYVSARELTLPAGDTATVGLAARRGQTPVPGIRVVLEGSGSVGSAGGPDLATTTDASGNARFDFPVGTRTGTYPLRVRRDGAPPTASAPIRLDVTAARAAAVELRPSTLRIGADGVPEDPVEAVVVDRYGNPVPSVTLAARSGDDDTRPALEETTTDGRGRAWLAPRVAPDADGAVARLTLWSDGRRVGALPVRHDGAVAGVGAPGAGRAADGRRASIESLRASARTALEAGRLPAAIATLREAADAAPRDAEVWLDLGRAWRSADRIEAARRSLLRARSLVPPEGRSRVDSLLSELYGTPGGLHLAVWGGHTLDVEDAGGLRRVAFGVRAAPTLELHGRYDESVEPDFPALIRGPELLRRFAGGATLDWGPGAALYTRGEVGRREQVVGDFAETLYRVEQGVRFSTGRGAGRVYAGGLMGLWPDRDEWIGYAGSAIPVSLAVDLRAELYGGETVGTETPGVLSDPAREVRGRLGLEVRPAPGWRVAPTVGLGEVTADDEARSGQLWEADLRISVPIARAVGIDLFARHQAPPGADGVTVLAAGLHVGIR